MSDERYQIEGIGMYQFERVSMPVRGTLYRCVVCNGRPIKVKGVLAELTGRARTDFKRKFNAMHGRHKRVCVPQTSGHPPSAELPADGGDAEADGGVAVDSAVGDASAGGNGDASEAAADESGGGDGGVAADGGGGDGADGSGGGNDGENSEEEGEPPPPPPLDAAEIGRWTVHSVERALVHWREMPARIDGMQYIPAGIIGNPKVECFVRNEHGTNRFILSSTVLHIVPALRVQYEAAEARWKSARHQSLVELFERACARTSHEAVCTALNALLD